MARSSARCAAACTSSSAPRAGVVDHLNRGTLKLDRLTTLVLDEADEMLRMGFIDDVEAVLKATPDTRQVALFSATMPAQIRRIAQTYQNQPTEVTIKARTTTNTSTAQRVCMVGAAPGQKLEALTRVLETETFDGVIVFSRTRMGSEEIADRLAAEGHAVAAMNGDMDQKARERVVGRLKDGTLDIIVATDVAARGLDVERISLVVNFDIPTDPESYVHRIGRTGRAGRSGEAILLMTPRERHLLRLIERTTRQPVTPMEIPSVEAVNKTRISRFKKALVERLTADRQEAADSTTPAGRRAGKDVKMFRSIVEEIETEQGVPMADIAAALAHMAQGGKALLLESNRGPSPAPADDPRQGTRAPRGFDDMRADFNGPSDRAPRERSFKTPTRREPEAGMATFRVEVGYKDELKPGHLVAAVSNEAGIDGRYIGRIEIFDDYSLMDMPDDMPADILGHLQNVFVRKRKLRMSRVDTDGSPMTSTPPQHVPQHAHAPSSRSAPPPFVPKTDTNAGGPKTKPAKTHQPAAPTPTPTPAPMSAAAPAPAPAPTNDAEPAPAPVKKPKKPKADAPVETVLPTVAVAPVKKKKKSKNPDNVDNAFGDAP